jgi:hypothetical protein
VLVHHVNEAAVYGALVWLAACSMVTPWPLCGVITSVTGRA